MVAARTGVAAVTAILGIDPGKSGAIAMVEPGVDVWDMPATPADLAALLKTFDPAYTRVYLEQAQAMPKQGVSSTFGYGRDFGVILGVLATVGLSHRLVTPAVWKRQMGVTADKSAARAMAQRLFPSASLGRVKDHGRAEALLIAEWGRRQS